MARETNSRLPGPSNLDSTPKSPIVESVIRRWTPLILILILYNVTFEIVFGAYLALIDCGPALRRLFGHEKYLGASDPMFVDCALLFLLGYIFVVPILYRFRPRRSILNDSLYFLTATALVCFIHISLLLSGFTSRVAVTSELWTKKLLCQAGSGKAAVGETSRDGGSRIVRYHFVTAR
jgi:hypothetical protein